MAGIGLGDVVALLTCLLFLAVEFVVDSVAFEAAVFVFSRRHFRLIGLPCTGLGVLETDVGESSPAAARMRPVEESRAKEDLVRRHLRDPLETWDPTA